MMCLHQRSLLSLLLPPWSIRAVNVGAKTGICDPNYIVGVEQAKAKFQKIVSKGTAKGTSIALLLYGPHGSGKSLVIRSVLSSYKDRAVFIVNMEDFVAASTQYEGSKLMGMMLRNFKKHSGGILVLDDIDHLFSNRPGLAGAEVADMRVELLAFMKQLKEKQEFTEIVIATATKPWRLEKSLLETFQLKIVMPVPTLLQRSQLIKRELSNVRCSSYKESDMDDLASNTEHYSGYQVISILRLALSRNLPRFESITLKEDAERADHVTKHDIQAVANIIQADIVEGELRKYANFATALGAASPEARRSSGNVTTDAARRASSLGHEEVNAATTGGTTRRTRRRSVSASSPLGSPVLTEAIVPASTSADHLTACTKVSSPESRFPEVAGRRKSMSASPPTRSTKARRRQSVASPTESTAAPYASDRRPSNHAPSTGQWDGEAGTGRRKSITGAAPLSVMEPPAVDSPPVRDPEKHQDGRESFCQEAPIYFLETPGRRESFCQEAPIYFLKIYLRFYAKTPPDWSWTLICLTDKFQE
ncbi:hypothetical protein HPB48_021269 [Haemaphysalis longicornis]|uniref:AAA+ ATPase domain-containing protein n=1 Tax=Haemaphysalis longicornis TaxID=44386 RepID=A0A9J6GBI5_HAELO|nr:hypothetical protein HPB48_021269 [Haemaphysalis longicornis]